jgi:cysteine desulfurase NifS
MSANKKYKNSEQRALCGICPAGCWIIVTYDSEGRMKSVRPDESSSFGVICKLGEHSPEIVYSKDRLQYPMRRNGPKGTYEFERISWDEAYEIIVDRLNRIKTESGPEATAMYTGRGSFELAMCDVYQPEGVAVSSASSVLFPFGSPNTLGVGALCYVSFAMIAPHVTMGGMLINMFSDIEHADLIVVWGANPATDCPPLDLDRIIKAHERGASIIVIDPRRTMMAKLPGAEWIPVRPGTDGALALGMCNVIIHEELYDEAFVLEWTKGFEEFSRYVQHFRPEVVEQITGVPADTVISVARRLAEADGASPVMYSGLEYSDSGVQAIRATQGLWALAGQLDVPGGRCFSMKENQFPVNRKGQVANPDLNKALGRDRFPVYSQYRGESHAMALPDSVIHGRPYKIRSLIILGGSMITAWPQPSIWRDTLNNLDFLVCIDRQLTADSAYADIVLPATTMYEIDSYMTYGPIFRIREKVIDPVGEARNDFFIMAELAKRLGYGEVYPQNEKELLSYVLKGSGFTPDEVCRSEGMVRIPTKIMEYKKWEKGLLRNDGKPGFDTPSGKFEIASSILEEHGYDPLPVYTEPQESPESKPELVHEFPLIFNSGSRVNTDFRSQHHGIPGLSKERPEPAVTINTSDAEERGIENGDLVQIKTARGRVVMRALVTDDIVNGAVDANMGGGGPIGPEQWKTCNINELTDLDRYDPISGFPVYKALLCDVEKIVKGEGTLHISSGEYMFSNSADRHRAGRLKEDRVYLDHNATTPLAPEVKEVMIEQMNLSHGNPSSIYEEGKKASFVIESSRRSIARLLNCTARRIIYTGGGSESNNLAIKGIAFSKRNQKNHIITSSIEHPSVLSVCQWLEHNGFDITYLKADRSGIIDPADLVSAITDKTFLASIMMANNETGSIMPVKLLARLCRERDVFFHTDATQAIGKIAVDVDDLNVDLLTMSGHKVYGPKGTGVLYYRKGISLEPLIHGGKQEQGLRAGTENVAGIAGLGKAAELAGRNLAEMDRLRTLRDRLERGIKKLVPGSRLNGHENRRLPNTLNMLLPGLRGESMVLAMDQRGIAFSSGSACRAGSPKPSHALLAIGLTEEEAHCSVRLSLGLTNKEKDIELTLKAFKQVIRDASMTARFVPCR